MKQTLQLGAFSLANVLSVVLFQWLLLTMLGPGQETDALFAALTVPMLFATVIGSSLTQVLVPLLSGESEQKQRKDSWLLINLCAVLFFCIALLLGVSAGWWAPLTVPGFTEDGKALTVLLSQISVIGLIFSGINSVQLAVAFANGRYIWADTAQVVANITALVLLPALLPIFGIAAAAWITVGRLAIQTVLLMRGMGHWVSPDKNAPIVKEAWFRIKPMLLGSAYYKMDPLLDRYLLSSMAAGSISILYLAQQLYAASSQIVTKALATPAITRLSIAHKAADTAVFSNDLRKTLVIMAAVALAGLACLGLIGLPLLRMVIEHGQFTANDSYSLWLLLLLTGGQFFAGCLGALVAGAFYARGDTLTPTLLGSISFTISIAVKILMFHYFAFYGLAIAISIYYCQSLLFMLIVLRRRKYI